MAALGVSLQFGPATWTICTPIAGQNATFRHVVDASDSRGACNATHPESLASQMARDERLNSFIQTAMHELPTAFSTDFDLEQGLSHVTAAAVDLVDGVNYADIMLVDQDKFRSLAPTAALVTDLDNVQMGDQQGPCLDGMEATWGRRPRAAIGRGLPVSSGHSHW